MTKVRYIPDMKKFYVLFSDGGKGWCSERGMEELFPSLGWEYAKEHPEKWFYI